jgi:hypothetical protein
VKGVQEGISAVFVFGWDGVDAISGTPSTHNFAVASARNIAATLRRWVKLPMAVAAEASIYISGLERPRRN